MKQFRATMPDGRKFQAPCHMAPVKEEIVFYTDNTRETAESVRDSLVNHDGYPAGIVVREVRKVRR